MSFSGRGWGAVLLALAAAGLSAAGAEPRIVACSGESGCAEAAGIPKDADFVWIWWDDTAPVRVLPAEAGAIVARGPARGISTPVHVQRRGEGVLHVMAAPARMWEEVPEPLLPRFAVPASGTVSVPRARNVPWKARLAAGDAGSWWTPLERAATSIPLVPASTRRLRVIGEDGAALAGAGIAVSVARAGASRTLAAQYSAGANGSFLIEGLPDREPLTLIVSARGYAPLALTERLPGLPETIELRRGVSVGGRFIDDKEAPLGGVRVRAETWLGAGSGVVARETSSSAGDGSWTIPGLPPGARVTLVATRNGLGTLRRDVVAGKSIDLGPIVLEQGAVLPFRVVDAADRRPVGGASVTAGPDRAAKTDAKGLARLIDVAASESLEVSVAADGYLPHAIPLSPPFDSLVEIELTRAFVVEGRFEDRNGTALPEATARVVIDDSFRDEPLEGAAFRLSLPPDRRVSIELSSPLSRTVRLDVEGTPGETRNLGVLHADEGPAIRGRVVTPDGAPVASANAWTPRATGAGSVVEWATGNVLRAESDGDGHFRLRGGGPEPVLLRIDAPGFARTFRSVSFHDGGGHVDLGEVTLSRGATVTVAGRAEWTDAVVQATARPETGAIDVLTASMHEGSAVVRNVPEGRVVVSVLRGRSTVCQRELDVVERKAPLVVDCSSGAVRVSGLVFVGERPSGGGTLLWTPAASAVAAGVIMNSTSRLGAVHQQPFGAGSDVLLDVDERGQFASDALWPGKWLVLRTSAAGGMSEPREVAIEEKPETRVVLRYAEAAVRGVVVDERSQPVSRATVRQLEGNATALASDDGTFAILGLAPGTYRFRASDRALRSDVAVVEIEAGREPEPLRMVLRRDSAGALTVNVRAADGSPAAGALMFVETSAGETRIVTAGHEGRAVVSFEDGVPASVRLAATHGGAWVFDPWRPSDSLREGRTLAFGETGAIAIETDSADGSLDIRAPHGWDLRLLLLRIGAVPLLRPNVPLEIFGLPPGTYEVSAGKARSQVVVRRGETANVSLRR